ncbi:unnamed protein product [Caenorhabditis brenneri]
MGSKQKQNLIRLQNPWGEKEWNGAWSDDSSEWQNVSDSQLTAMGVQRGNSDNNDGDFWMPWESFVQYFTDISLCQLFNTSVFSFQKSYDEQIVFSEWTTNGKKSGAPDDRAGGCLNFPATFCNNPQYIFDIPSPNCSVMFALTQNDPSEGLKKREPFVTIGMHVMKVENNRQFRVHQAMQPVDTSDYASGRSVYLHLQSLPRGRYLLVPTTFAPKEQALFMLRIYSDEKIHFSPLTKHAPKLGMFGCKAAHSVTRLTIHGINLNSASSYHSLYAILKDSNKSFRTKSLNGEKSIEWSEQFLFHKSKDRQQYKLEIWEDRKMARDHLMAQTVITALIDNENRDTTLELTDPRGNTMIGTVTITVSAFDDPMYL